MSKMLVYQLCESPEVLNPYGRREYKEKGMHSPDGKFHPVICGGGPGVGRHCRIAFVSSSY